MIATVLSFFGSGIAGTIFGFAGNLITQYNDRKMLAIKQTHELALMDKESEIIIKETEARIEVAREETRGAIEIADQHTYEAALKAESKTLFKKEYMDYLMRPVEHRWQFNRYVLNFCGAIIAVLFGVVDILKMAVRPSVTYYWVVITTIVTIQLEKELGGLSSLDAVQQKELFQWAVNFIFFECSTILSFWFCDRRNSKSRKTDFKG